MPIIPLPRLADGRLASPTRNRQRMAVDFASATPTRQVSDAAGASGSPQLTSASKQWRATDVGAYVAGTGVAENARVLSVTGDGGAATLSANNTAAVSSSAAVTSWPSWLTLLNSWSSKATIEDGKAVFTNGSNVSAVTRVEGPVLDLSGIAFVDVTVRGVDLNDRTAQLYAGVGLWNPGWMTNSGHGAFIGHRQGQTQVELRAAIAETITQEMAVSNGYVRSAVREDFTFRLDVARKLVYGLVEGHAVQAARDLSAVMNTTGPQVPIIATRGNGGIARFAGFEIDVWRP